MEILGPALLCLLWISAIFLIHRDTRQIGYMILFSLFVGLCFGIFWTIGYDWIAWILLTTYAVTTYPPVRKRIIEMSKKWTK